MEITIEIPKNDYVQPTEVRPDVVKAICEAFLANTCWRKFRPHDAGLGRPQTKCAIRHRGGEFYGFMDKPFDTDDGVEFNGAETKSAFRVLVNAGYHMFRQTEGREITYVCNRKPYDEWGTEVNEFNEFID